MVSAPASVLDNITGLAYLEDGTPMRVLVRGSSERAAPWSGISVVVLPRADGKPPAHRRPQSDLRYATSRSRGTAASIGECR